MPFTLFHSKMTSNSPASVLTLQSARRTAWGEQGMGLKHDSPKALDHQRASARLNESPPAHSTGAAARHVAQHNCTLEGAQHNCTLEGVCPASLTRGGHGE
uniref:Uncharacterized protein n=1 Tax=Eutreptiella gymnastica TaxID=73025 RepID=A0A7S4G9Z3_9EUGL